MKYAKWRRQNPGWPERLKDVVGRRVKLRHDIEAETGAIYHEGKVLLVIEVEDGRLTLKDLKDPENLLRRVDLKSAEVVS